MYKSKLMAIVLSLTLTSSAYAEKVFDVHDGDSFRLVNRQSHCTGHHKRRKHEAIRMHGIDSPELSQPMGLEARNALQGMISGKRVELKCDSCSHTRETCTVYLNGKDVESEMVRQGWAFDYPVYSLGKYAPEEDEAKQAHRGVWKLENGGQRPWDYRAAKRLHSKTLKNVS